MGIITELDNRTVEEVKGDVCIDDIMDVAIDEGLPHWECEQKKFICKHYAAECKEKEKFLRYFFKSIGIPKKF